MQSSLRFEIRIPDGGTGDREVPLGRSDWPGPGVSGVYKNTGTHYGIERFRKGKMADEVVSFPHRNRTV